MHGSSFVADLAVVVGVAALTALVARRLKQPTILGYLFAGLIVGPYLPVPLFADPERVESVAELGVVLVMFAVGLELRLGRLARVLPISGVTGLVQVGFLAWAGFSVGLMLGWSLVESLFLGGSLAISSTMVVTRVFDEVSVPRDVREHVLGILVVQDVLAIALIAALTAVAAGGGLEPSALFVVLAKLAAVLVGLFAFGLLLVPRLLRNVAETQSAELLGVVAIAVCFGLGHLAELLGYSVALGAFVAGVLVAESGRGRKVEHLIAPLRDLFAAIFFVSVGMSVDPLQAAQYIPETAIVVVVIVVCQLFSVSFAGVLSGNGLRRSVFAGLALGQLGEFAFIISTLGREAGVVRPELRPILVSAAVVTAFTTPLALRYAESLLRALDHVLPGPVLRLVSLYERWFSGWRDRKRPAAADGQHPLRHIAFDALALTLTVALSLSWRLEIIAFLEKTLGADTHALAPILFGLGVLALALPLLAALVRNTLALSRRIADDIAPSGGSAPGGSRVVRRLVRSTVHFLVALGVGFPALAILRPLAPGPVGLPVLGLLLAGIGVVILRDVGRLDRAVRSGTAAVAERLAKEMGTELPHTIDLAPPSEGQPAKPAPPNLPGLDAVQGWRVPDGAFAVGQSLAELDLRASTGAAVVTLQRGAQLLSLPRGEERIEAGDVLGMLGGPRALAEGQSLLLDGPREETATPPGPAQTAGSDSSTRR